MTWIIKLDGIRLESDDFTIAELGEVEKATGEPWSTTNPLRSIKAAEAFLAVVMLRSGRPEPEVIAALESLTLRTLKSAFEWQADEEGEQEERDPSAPNPSSTSPDSSTGDGGTAGSPATPAGSA